MLKLAALLLFFAAAALDQEPKELTVMKASAETGDAIAFQISVRKTVYEADEDIKVQYVVQNKGRKTIYLVTKDSYETRIPDSWVVELSESIDPQDAHLSYRYRMIKISPGKSYRGRRTVETKILKEHRKYSFDVTRIQVGFAYIFDINDLGDHCRNYSLPCLGKVWAEARVVKLGNLVVRRNVE